MLSFVAASCGIDIEIVNFSDCDDYAPARSRYCISMFIENQDTVEVFLQNLQHKISLLQIPYHEVGAIKIRASHHNTRINHIPDELFSVFPKLRTLRSDLQISGIASNGFVNAKNLSKLQLTDSKGLRKLLAGTFPPMKLTKLYLPRNAIQSIDDFTFANLTYLQRLHLQNNKLTIIKPHTFTALFQLRALYLEENQIHTIESGAFVYLTKLQYLDLSRNKIQILNERIFSGRVKLKWLDLSDNHIESIVGLDVLRNRSKLVELDLRGNDRLTGLDKKRLRDLLKNSKVDNLIAS